MYVRMLRCMAVTVLVLAQRLLFHRCQWLQMMLVVLETHAVLSNVRWRRNHSAVHIEWWLMRWWLVSFLPVFATALAVIGCAGGYRRWLRLFRLMTSPFPFTASLCR